MKLYVLLAVVGLVGGLLDGWLGLGGVIILAPLLLYMPPTVVLSPLNMKKVARYTTYGSETAGPPICVLSSGAGETMLTQQNHLISSSQLNGETNLDKATRALREKYQITSWFYDILDYPWERQYRRWRPLLLQDLSGRVLEAGVGTGRNLRHYPREAHVVGVDFSLGMLSVARKRTKQAVCEVTLLHSDATRLSDTPACQFDWYIATFLYCVLPDELQPLALSEMVRVLKPGGRFRILEIVYSKDPRLSRRQKRLARLVETLYGARFDRHTLQLLQQNDCVEISETRFLKADTYLLIEGYKKNPEERFQAVTAGPVLRVRRRCRS